MSSSSYYMKNSKSGDVIGVVLAGGEGKRFRPYTDIIPKPMLPVGPEERPLLEYIVKWFSKHGITRITLLVGYRWRQIANYFSDGSRWGVKISMSLDTEEYKGTGGALLNAYKSGMIKAENALIWYGDILAPVDLSDLLTRHIASEADATIVLASKYQVPVGVAEVDEDLNIVSLSEKPWLQLKVSIGILALKTTPLSFVEDELGKTFDIMGDLIPWMINKGFSVKAYLYDGVWFDIGSMERYAKLDHNSIAEFLK